MDRNASQRQIDSPKLDLSFIDEGYLFDRQSEIEKIYEAFYRGIEPGAQSELILISGISGTGKTVLANKLKEPVELMGGYFISGKFDQLQKPQQYSAFASAFADFVRLLLKEGPNAVEEKKHIILKDIGSDNRLLVETFPVLKNIIGTTKYDGTKIMGQAIQSRLELAVGKFVTAICSNESPLVVLMDDLQWADSGSLELLESLVSNKRIEGLVVAGVCRSNKVPWGHDFAAMLRRLEEKRDTLISHIIVKSLTWDSANHVVSRALQVPILSCKPITDILVARTKGNIFFLLQLLQEFYNDSILEHDCSQDLWTLNVEKLRVAKDQDVVDLIVKKITKMPDKTQTVLMTGACLGATFDLALLSKVLDGVDVLDAIQMAIEKNIVNYDEQLNRCTFSHDQMQQAAYALVADSEKALVHLTIGRRLLETFRRKNILDHIFLVTDQMVRGSSLLENGEEKNQLATLCLRAGIEAARSGDFKTSSVHFWQGIGLLRKRHWRDEYDLSLELYSSVAETEYCIAGFEKMDKAVEEVLANGRSSTDKLRAHSAKIYLLWAQGKPDESIDLGISVLSALGVEFPSKIGKVHVLGSILKTKFLLRKMSYSDFLAIGDMKDPIMIAAMGIMNHILIYAGTIRTNTLMPLLATRIIQMSLKYGVCVISAYGISAYGVLLNLMGDYENGYRMGRISLSILSRYQHSTTWVSRVYLAFYGYISPWTRPVSISLDPLLEAHDLGIKNGDIEAAMLAVRLYDMLAFFSGAPLSQMTEKLNCHADKMEKFNQRTYLLGTNLQLNLIKCFTGAISGNLIAELASDDILHEQKCKKYYPFNAQHQLWTLIVAYHFGDIDIALKAVISIPQHETWLRMHILFVMKVFYNALVSLEAAWIRPTPHKQRKNNISVAKNNRKKLQKLCTINPKNCTNKLLLLDAELAGLRGARAELILDMYDRAISVAGVEGFIHEQALASERASVFMRRRGDASGSKKYFNRAVALYKEWGATRKVTHMLDTHRSSR